MNMQRILSGTAPVFDDVTKRWGPPPTVPAVAPLRPTSPLSVADAAAYNASPEGRATAVETKMNAAKAKVPNAFTGPAAANPATMAADAAKAPGMKAMPPTSMAGRAGTVASQIGENLAKDKFAGPILRGASTVANLPGVKQTLGLASKVGGVGATAALYTGDAGAPTLDAERVAAMGRPWDPNWQPKGTPAVPRNQPASPLAAPAIQSTGATVAPAAPTALPRTQFLRGGTDAAKAASAQIDSGGGYIPGNGNGMLRNQTTGDVMKFNNATGPALAPGEDARIAKWHADGDRAREASYARSAALRAPSPVSTDGSGWADEVAARKKAARDADRDVTLRGQDIASADGRYGHQLTNEVARNRLRYDMGKDQRDFAVTSRAAEDVHLKGNAEAAKDVYKNKFWKKDDKNNDVRDERAEKHAEDISNQLSKGAFGIRARSDQSELQQDTQELTNMFTQIETPRKTGTNKYLSMVGMGDTPATLSAMPNFNGGTMKKLGMNMTAGTGNNDYEITDANNRVHYMSSMSKRQRELLEEMGIKSFDSPDALRKETK